MTWTRVVATNALDQISDKFPEVETDYVDPLINRSLSEHLKSYWLIRVTSNYAVGYEANKVRELLEPKKFSEKDWCAIASVCGFKKSWAVQRLEEYESAA